METLCDGEFVPSEVITPWVEFEKVGRIVEYMRFIGWKCRLGLTIAASLRIQPALPVADTRELKTCIKAD